MTKRLLAFAMALIMVLSLLPVVVIAEEPDHIHCLCGETTTLDADCVKCGSKAAKWTAWGNNEGEDKTLPKDGYYYLTKDVSTGMVEFKNGNTAICLNGHDLKSLNGYKIMTVYNTAVVSLCECSETPGKISGSSKDTYGLCLRVNEGGTLNLYGGHVTGNTGTSTGDGVVYVDKGNSVPGGIFNMYGGEISGNTARRGAGVYTATGGTYPATVRILGGTITANHGTGTGATGGGAGVLSFYPVEIGGDAKIFGNTGAVEPADILLRNDGSFTGALVLSTDKPLADGAKINYGVKTAEADLNDIQSITGTPGNWDPKWLTLNGQYINFADGKFFVDTTVVEDHIHCLCGAEKTQGVTCASCGSVAAEWTGITEMPAVTESGWFYLQKNVTVSPMFYNGVDIAFCLCGHTMTSAEGKRMLDAQGGAVITITDCAETAGMITGATGATNNGSVMRANAGSAINIYNGKITGNTGASDGIIYAAEGTTELAGGTVTIYGGEISNNTVRRGTVYTALGTNGKLPGKLRILGGVITGNTATGTGNVGGGAGVLTFYPIELGGNAQIYGNIATTGFADLYLRDDQGASIVLSEEKPLTEGAQINYVSKNADNKTELALISGNPTTWDSAWITYDGENVDFADGKFFINTVVPEGHIHCQCGKELTYNATCASCGTKAVLWLAAEAGVLPKTTGHFYLTDDVSTGAVTFTDATNTSICLNGHNVSSQNGWKIMNVEKGASLTITDCSENVGSITGSNKDNYGLCLRVNAGSVINFYNGKITGNSGSETGDGIVYVDKGDASTIGGTFNMYGGEISGNTARRGSAVYGALATGDQKDGVIRILGGTITGNNATGTGSTSGGAICAFCAVEIGGDAKVYGNTAATAGVEDIFLRNDGYNGKLVLSSTKPLTDGAQINYNLKTAEADNTDLKYITGTPSAWSDKWVSYNGEKVNYTDGKFTTAREIIYSDHQHDGQQWISVTNENKQWPSGDGYYVLEEDVQLKNILTVLKDNHVHLCLNGHTLTAADGAGHYDLRGGSKLTICDCTAATAEDGTYTAGKITGGKGSNGGVVRARAGAEVYLYDGIITGNTTAGNGGFIYMDAQSDLFPAAVFVMYGGEISGNTGAYGAAIRMGAPSADMAGPTFRMEGGAIRGNESPNYGGGMHVAGGATIDLIGGVIEDNIAALGGGAISTNGNTVINLSGTVIRNNSAATWGGGIYLKAGAVMNMTGGEVSGNSSKVGAGILLESIDTTLNLDGGKITGNQAGAAGGAGVYASFNTIVNMTGGEISDNEAQAGGGGITISGGAGNFTGGKITGNKAPTGGAGMRLTGTNTFLGNVEISGNVSDGSAGGVYVAREGSTVSNVIIDGAQIINNTCKSSGGGMYLYMNGNSVTMKSGKISGNQAQDGGGVVAQREVTFTLEGGEISGNSTKGSGGGFYSSIDATFIINGGSITGNYAEKSGGGLVVLRGKAQLNGGSISYNTSKGSAAGVYINGSYATMSGTWVGYNKATEASGAGVMVNSTTATVDGVSKRFAGRLDIYGGVITENFTPKAGAGLLLQREDTVVNMYGGKITKNTATKFAAGVYVGNKSMFNMHGGQVSYNVSENDVAAGIRHDGGGGNYTGGEIFGNVTSRSGGGVIVGGTGNKVTMKNVKIYDNTAKVGGGFVLQSKDAQLIMEDCEIYNNTATQEGAGGYVYTYCNYYATNCHFHDNTTQGNGAGLWSWATSYVYLTDCLFENNKAENEGGAIWTRNDGFFITGCTIRNNSAGGNGGAVFAGRMSAASDGFKPHMNIENTLLENNTSGGIGGAAYMSSGAMCKLIDVTFLNNSAAAEAGAIWAKDEFSMHNVTATGNKSGGEGYAVYLAESEYDGHSYIAGEMLMSGNMQIHDNPGGDLYLGKQTTLSITEQGLAEETKIHVTIYDGLLTQMVWGAYNYEGGDQIYTITYGNRSIVDPEIPEAKPDTTDPVETTGPVENTEPVDQNENTMIYAGIGAFIAVIAAVAAIVVAVNVKKKKAAAK